MHLEKQATTEANDPLNVLVVGASGGTGRATVKQLLENGHKVTAFSRRATDQFEHTINLRIIDGDVMQNADISEAVKGQDVVIVVLGISENPVLVRLFASASTPRDVRSKGTKNIIAAMKKHGVSRLIVQSSFGVGETRGLLRFTDRLIFSLLLKPQIKDTELQEQVVRASGNAGGIDWVLAQPVHLKDAKNSSEPYLSTQGKTRQMSVTRRSVARFLADAVNRPDFIGKTVAISG